MIKVHLGCWKRNFPGFINVDLADFPHIQHNRIVDDLSPFEDNSVDLIYASHVLEYFYLDDVPRVLKEWRRVLKPKGILKIAVPDFEGLAKAYLKYGNVLDVRGPLFGFFDITNKDGQNMVLNHKIVYDFKLIKKVLEENGFGSVQKYDWKDFLPEGQEDHSSAHIPSRDFANGILVSLNVEAVKTGELSRKILKMKHETFSLKNKAKNKLIKWIRNL